jgi:hypothetical protein
LSGLRGTGVSLSLRSSHMSRNSRHPADDRVSMPDAAQRCEPSVTQTRLINIVREREISDE